LVALGVLAARIRASAASATARSSAGSPRPETRNAGKGGRTPETCIREIARLSRARGRDAQLARSEAPATLASTRKQKSAADFADAPFPLRRKRTGIVAWGESTSPEMHSSGTPTLAWSPRQSSDMRKPEDESDRRPARTARDWSRALRKLVGRVRGADLLRHVPASLCVRVGRLEPRSWRGGGGSWRAPTHPLSLHLVALDHSSATAPSDRSAVA
jgi:hypothetical protein